MDVVVAQMLARESPDLREHRIMSITARRGTSANSSSAHVPPNIQQQIRRTQVGRALNAAKSGPVVTPDCRFT